jgi:hypothetical protein
MLGLRIKSVIAEMVGKKSLSVYKRAVSVSPPYTSFHRDLDGQ